MNVKSMRNLKRNGRPVSRQTELVRKKVHKTLLTATSDMTTIEVAEKSGLKKESHAVVVALRFFEQQGAVQRRQYRKEQSGPGQRPLVWSLVDRSTREPQGRVQHVQHVQRKAR